MVLIILLILLFLIKSSQIYFGYRSIKKLNFALLGFHVVFETWDFCFKWIFFTSEKPSMGRNLGWNRASWLWYRVRRVSHWPPGRLTPTPQKASAVCYLSLISIPCLRLQHWQALCRLCSTVTYNPGLPTPWLQKQKQHRWPEASPGAFSMFGTHMSLIGGPPTCQSRLVPLASIPQSLPLPACPAYKAIMETLVKYMGLVSLLWVW